VIDDPAGCHGAVTLLERLTKTRPALVGWLSSTDLPDAGQAVRQDFLWARGPAHLMSTLTARAGWCCSDNSPHRAPFAMNGARPLKKVAFPGKKKYIKKKCAAGEPATLRRACLAKHAKTDTKRKRMQNCPECETLIYNNTIAAPSLALTPQAAPVARVATEVTS